MKRAQVAALVAGAALGLAGVTTAVVVFSRKENREKAIELAKTSAKLGKQGRKAAGEWVEKGTKVAGEWAEQARQIGGDVAKQAVEQYQTQAPKAVETLNNLLPKLGVGKSEAVASHN
jgi:polyhydroxyalkanoate synthesis regulator phasin